MKKFIAIIFCAAMVMLFYSCVVPESKYDTEKGRADSLQRLLDKNVNFTSEDSARLAAKLKVKHLVMASAIDLQDAQRRIYDYEHPHGAPALQPENLYIDIKAWTGMNNELNHRDAVPNGIYLKKIVEGTKTIWFAWAALENDTCKRPLKVWELYDYSESCICRPCCTDPMLCQ